MKSGVGVQNILICGGGLAAWMSACALRTVLPPSVKIKLIDIIGSDIHDIFYGTVSTPTSYNFNLAIGVSEPELLLSTATSFSYGTSYKNWGVNDLSWIQCHHLPFPVFDGIPFTNIVSAHGEMELECYLASARAALSGRFIHPPIDPSNPLSRAEYGYQFSPPEWKNIFRQTALDKGIELIEASAITVNRTGDQINTVEMPDGTHLSADFYVDCRGPNVGAVHANDSDKLQSKLEAVFFEKPAANLGPPIRQIKGTTTGWTSETYLQDRVLHFDVCDESSAENMRDAVRITTGRKSQAWTGNCLAIGHAASVIEPLTPAPIMLLQRDIERMLTLIPLSDDMTVEAWAYNQAFSDDYHHALIFNNAFFALPQTFAKPYWTSRQSPGLDDKLARKLTQFESRGLHVAYDLEPFNEQDWAILNFGMDRRPNRTDIFANLQDEDEINQKLNNIRQSLMSMTEKMPPHHIYMDKLISYLKRKQGSHV